MSIDADLNAGIITDQEARQEERRFNKKLIFTARWTAPASLSKGTLSLP
jgi:hypothetical protein